MNLNLQKEYLPAAVKTYLYYFRNIKQTPNWAYVVVHDKTLYNDNVSVDFELHASEEVDLTINTSDNNTKYNFDIVEPYIFNKKLDFIY